MMTLITKKTKPIVGITMGDPAGIGPEIVVKALSDKTVYEICKPLIVGNGYIVEKSLSLSDFDWDINRIRTVSQARYEFGTIDVFDLPRADLATLE